MVAPRQSSPRAALRTTRISTREIAAVVKKIATEFQPEKIILFGSYAYGRPTADSDVDLLVIMETTLRPRQQRLRISRALSPHPFPMDIVVKTPEHLSERLTLGDQFLHQIMEHGRVMYERPRR